jgi:hypothetical protein
MYERVRKLLLNHCHNLADRITVEWKQLRPDTETFERPDVLSRWLGDSVTGHGGRRGLTFVSLIQKLLDNGQNL